MFSLFTTFSRQTLATSKETLFVHDNYDERMYTTYVHILNLPAFVEFA